MIKVKNLSKHYNNTRILDNLSFEVKKGEAIAILGRSGSGKSTLLKTLAGLLPYQSGNIIAGTSIKFGFVFQSFELFPHMNVLENITLAPIKVLKKSRELTVKEAMIMLERVHMQTYVNSYPAELSGGQQQRVAIARALCMHPTVMLFDEPTSALDPEMVGEVLTVIKELRNAGMTILIASHEMGFIKKATDAVIFMDKGKIIEKQSTALFFSKPLTESAKAFLAVMRHE